MAVGRAKHRLMTHSVQRRYTPVLKGKTVQRLLLGSLAILVLSFFVNVKLVLFLAAAIVFNAWLATFQLSKGLPTDFELSTFSTVIMTYAFGLKMGLITAVVTKVVASVYSGNIIADHLFMIATYCWAAIVASMFHGVDITTLGLIIVVMNNLIMFTISKAVLNISITENISYTVTNFMFNLVMFSAFIGPVYSVVRG